MDLKDPSPLQFYDQIRERRQISEDGKNHCLISVSIRSTARDGFRAGPAHLRTQKIYINYLGAIFFHIRARERAPQY